MYLTKTISVLIGCLVLSSSPMSFADDHYYKRSYYSTRVDKTKPPVNLPLYKEESKTSKVVGEITTTQNFNGAPSPWVKISSADGKIKGWAHVDDIEAHIRSLEANAYLIETVTKSGKYTVNKISPEEQKERYKKAKKRARALMQQQRKVFEDVFFYPYTDLDENYDIGEDDKDNVALKNRVDHLDKKVEALEKQAK